MNTIKHEITIMSAVADSMLGKTEPILGTGFVSARAHLIGRMNCVVSLQQVQQTARRMCFEDGTLVMEDGVLRLDIDKATERVKYLLQVVESEHPASEKTMQPLRDMIKELMDRVVAAFTGYPTVVQPAS